MQTEISKITPGQIKLIHVLKGKLGLTDEAYRSILLDYHAFSSTQLSSAQAEHLIWFLQKNAEREGKWIRPAQRYANLTGRRGMATPKQLRMIEAMWADVSTAYSGVARAVALKTFLRRFGAASMEELEYWQVHKVVSALQAMQASRQA